MTGNEARKRQNEKAFAGIREATARYITQLRSEGLPEEEIQREVESSNIEVVREMGTFSPGEAIPAELSQSISALVKDIMV